MDVFGSYIFKNEAGQPGTVNSARYCDIINEFFLPKLHDMDVADM